MSALGKINAVKLLRASGLTPVDEHYRFFERLLTAHFEKTTGHENTYRAIGKEILQYLAAGQLGELQELGEFLTKWEVGADMNAVRLIAAGAHGQAKREKTNRNLRRKRPMISKADIAKAVLLHRTRDKQAASLGISRRHLQRLLRKG